ncbi:hypothetical protein MPSEU_000725900 [Mayamaea pseudoterrestris]|nr:hypothetical protein MPSEU_000725900 [Mayamaea pseudoterrestris]
MHHAAPLDYCSGRNVELNWITMIPRSVGRIELSQSPWFPLAATSAILLLALIAACSLPGTTRPYYHIAFIGNSMQYYNDLPRFMEALSDYHLTQDSCLHGDATLQSILLTGNGMYQIWKDSGSARVYNDDATIHDFGACTVPQLLFGYDQDLQDRVDSNNYNQQQQQDDQLQQQLNDDFATFNDFKNPCVMDENYYYWLQQNRFNVTAPPHYDFVVINDNTRSPARTETRQASLQVLAETYVPMLLQTTSTPILICTYGYNSPYRDMGGLSTVPEFTSYTYQGYLEYTQLLANSLPRWQKPLISPVCLAFLIVHEDNYGLWKELFGVDKVHASPMGTYLQGLCIYATMYGALPPQSIAIRPDMSYLFLNVRRFQPGIHRRSPFPTQEQASYLYHVADRACVHGHLPRTLTLFKHKESVDYEPHDDLYRIDDLF